MRVLVLSWEYPPYMVGGMGKHAAGLVPALGGLTTKFGPLSVDLVTTRYAGGLPVEALSEYVTIHRVDMPALDPLDLYNAVVANNSFFVDYASALEAQHHYDLIHIHDWLPGSAGVALKHKWKIPLVTTVHATERGRHQGHLPSRTSGQIDFLEWQITFEAWRVVVCSGFMTGELNEYFSTPLDKIVVIPNGIDTTKLAMCPVEERTALRTFYAPNHERLLFYVGRIVYEKGLQVLIRAIPEILAEFPNTRLLAAGKNSRELLPLAHNLGVEGAVKFLDFVTDQQRDYIYQIADAAIFPSLYEPFGIVALEAMALGCNVVASDVGGLGEVVQHMQNGLTVYPNDPSSIAWAVRQLFLNPITARQRRDRAMYQVKHLYHWHEIAEQTTRLFEDVITERQQTDW